MASTISFEPPEGPEESSAMPLPQRSLSKIPEVRPVSSTTLQRGLLAPHVWRRLKSPTLGGWSCLLLV